MYKVKKRDGSLVEFEIEKIVRVIQKAFEAENKSYTKDTIEFIALKVTAHFNEKIKNEVISVEDIQDSVEATLIAGGYGDVAKSFILYRKQRERVRNAKNTLIDYKGLMDGYLKASDWRVKENSTVTYSLGGLILSNSGALTANYWLSEIYDKEIGDAHKNADIHIHDLSMLSGYCAGWSLRQLLTDGLGGVPGKISSSPAAHLSTLCNQMVNFLGIMQNEWAGAQAFSSFDTYLAPFVKVDNLSYKQVKQCIQSFIFGVNTPSRWGCQAPFTNITLDWTVPADLAELNCIVGGKETDFRYKDCQKEMDMVNKAFLEVMVEGDANGRGFQYPIPSYNITKDFDWSETENNKLLFEMTAKYGTPYFSNYINSDMEPSDVRSMCIVANSLVWCKLNGKTHHITIKELYDSDVEEKQISTRYGYRDIKELQRFGYQGDLLKFTTESGKTLTTTVDHEWVIYERPSGKRKWYVKDGRKKIFLYGQEKAGYEILQERADRKDKLIKIKAKDMQIGDFVSCRHQNAEELRKNKTYEEIYGENKARQIKALFSEQRTGREAWNKGIPQTEETKQKISQAVKGHYVSESCKQKSSERWLKNNPIHNQDYWNRCHMTSCLTSPHERQLVRELEGLGVEHIHQYVLEKYICDFYIPSKNLIIELETNYRGYNYNEKQYDFIIEEPEKILRYNRIKELGYNLLIYNPESHVEVYRQFINAVEKITDIEVINNYDGYVYDLEVDCDDVEGDTTMYHTFYANEILTGNCCRLRLDLRELRRKSGGFFGSGESTGSIGVVTINMPRIAYLAKDEKDFYKRLTGVMDLSARSLKVKREVVTELLEQGLYPYTKKYLGSFDKHFSTIGLIGMNEAGLNANWIKQDMTHELTQKFTKDVLNYMRGKLSDYQELYGDLYNLEATPKMCGGLAA